MANAIDPMVALMSCYMASGPAATWQALGNAAMSMQRHVCHMQCVHVHFAWLIRGLLGQLFLVAVSTVLPCCAHQSSRYPRGAGTLNPLELSGRVVQLFGATDLSAIANCIRSHRQSVRLSCAGQVRFYPLGFFAPEYGVLLLDAYTLVVN